MVEFSRESPRMFLSLPGCFSILGVEVALQKNIPAFLNDRKFLCVPFDGILFFFSLWGPVCVGHNAPENPLSVSLRPRRELRQIEQLFQSIKSQRGGLHAQSILKEVGIWP